MSTHEEATRRTRKMMLARPEFAEHLTYMHWLHTSGRPNTLVEKAAFDDLPDDRKGELRVAMWEACEAYWALSPEEQRSKNAASLQRTLAENDARWEVEDAPRIRRLLNGGGAA